MARVCRADGLVAIEDLIASEQPERAAYYNEFERLRDTSHTSALAMSELIKMMGAAGLEIVRFTSHGYRTPVSQWIKAARRRRSAPRKRSRWSSATRSKI